MRGTKTYSLSANDISKSWHVIDGSGQTLGRLSTHVAGLLMGKHKPTFSRHLDMGDFVIIVNASKIRVTGKKLDDKVYYRHTGYIGGLKETPLGEMLERHPARVVELAVRGMLPRNRLSRHLLRHLKVYPGPDHPHEAQVNESKKIEARRKQGAPAAPAPRRAKTRAHRETPAEAPGARRTARAARPAATASGGRRKGTKRGGKE